MIFFLVALNHFVGKNNINIRLNISTVFRYDKDDE